LRYGKRQSQEDRPYQRPRDANQPRGGEEQKGGQNEHVVDGYGTLPRQADKQGTPAEFLVGGKVGKAGGEQAGQRQQGEWEGGQREDAVDFARLEQEGDGRDDGGEDEGQDKFAVTVLGQADGRDGVSHEQEQIQREQDAGRQVE
jgi:hypothetical protein